MNAKLILTLISALVAAPAAAGEWQIVSADAKETVLLQSDSIQIADGEVQVKVVRDYRSAGLPQKERVLLDYVWKLSKTPGEMTEAEVLRETFAYGGGARDPFGSLINTKSAGPELIDLQLVGIYQDMRSSANSVAVLREKQSGKRHKLRTGDQIGRLRVAQIRNKDVVFTVEDFGFERQETLSLRKQEDLTQ